MCCNLFFFGGGIGTCFAKITRIVFSGLWSTARLSLQIGLLTCDDRRGAPRPLSCYAFIKIKLASCHLLLSVVYTCQKSFDFINASLVTSKNVNWPRLIWPTLYYNLLFLMNLMHLLCLSPNCWADDDFGVSSSN